MNLLYVVKSFIIILPNECFKTTVRSTQSNNILVVMMLNKINKSFLKNK